MEHVLFLFWQQQTQTILWIGYKTVFSHRNVTRTTKTTDWYPQAKTGVTTGNTSE